ncbi:MAG TPA: cysteine hydrolase [bacterium (Candidatus Stahlbacteria)]|nr:cysteine hydrolase [Candidatus Stahlbacteria bacterium]
MGKALLIIDMLNDFVSDHAPLKVKGAKEIIPNIKKQIKKARKNKIPIIYLCDRHKNDNTEFSIWPKHAIEGTGGAEIVAQLKPSKEDIIIHKTTYSGFFKTELEQILKQKNIDELIITGVATNICVLYTAADAYMRGYKVSVPEDCVVGITPEDHKFALRQIKEVLKSSTEVHPN